MVRYLATGLAVAALMWSISAGWRIWTTPVRHQTISWSADAQGRIIQDDGVAVRSFRDVSLLGPVPLIVPIAIAALALIAAIRRSSGGVAAAALMFVLFAFVGGFSIGGAYVIPGGMLILALLVSLIDRTPRAASKRHS